MYYSNDVPDADSDPVCPAGIQGRGRKSGHHQRARRDRSLSSQPRRIQFLEYHTVRRSAMSAIIAISESTYHSMRLSIGIASFVHFMS
jgi:hypothetical protein